MSNNQHEVVSQSVFEDKISEILSRREYIHLFNFIDKLKAKISDFIKKIFENTSLNLDEETINIFDNKIWFYVGLIILILIVTFVLLKILNRFQSNPSVKEILGEKIHKTTTPHSLREKATSYQSQGDLTQAIRLDFIALLFLMHEKRLLYLEESKTNKEIEKTIKEKKLYNIDKFHYLSETFNAVWYGKKYCNQETFTSWQEHINIVWKEVNGYEE